MFQWLKSRSFFGIFFCPFQRLSDIFIGRTMVASSGYNFWAVKTKFSEYRFESVLFSPRASEFLGSVLVPSSPTLYTYVLKWWNVGGGGVALEEEGERGTNCYPMEDGTQQGRRRRTGPPKQRRKCFSYMHKEKKSSFFQIWWWWYSRSCKKFMHRCKSAPFNSSSPSSLMFYKV